MIGVDADLVNPPVFIERVKAMRHRPELMMS
jgi:hypothetical protein